MASLYATLLGTAWSSLAPSVRSLHDGRARACGAFRVRRGSSLPGGLLAAMLGMPRPGEEVAVVLDVATSPEGERWTRAFAGQTLCTRQWQRGAHLVESLGPIQCVFRLRAAEGALLFEQIGSRVGYGRFTLPLPRILAPRITGQATPELDGVRVDVRVYAPLMGLLVAYEGIVIPGSPEVET